MLILFALAACTTPEVPEAPAAVAPTALEAALAEQEKLAVLAAAPAPDCAAIKAGAEAFDKAHLPAITGAKPEELAPVAEKAKIAGEKVAAALKACAAPAPAVVEPVAAPVPAVPVAAPVAPTTP